MNNSNEREKEDPIVFLNHNRWLTFGSNVLVVVEALLGRSGEDEGVVVEDYEESGDAAEAVEIGCFVEFSGWFVFWGGEEAGEEDGDAGERPANDWEII